MDPITQSPPPADTFSDVEDYDDPAGFNEMMGGLGGLMEMFGGGDGSGVGTAPAAAGPDFSFDTMAILDQLLVGDPSGYEVLKLDFAGLINGLATEVRELDLSDPMAVGQVKQSMIALFQQVESFMAANGDDITLMSGLGLLLGLADTLHATLVLAEADINTGQRFLRLLITNYDEMTGQFEAPGDLAPLLDQARDGVHDYYLGIMSTAGELGIDVQSLSHIVPESEPTDPSLETADESPTGPMDGDTLEGDAAFEAENEPSDPFADPSATDPLAPPEEGDPFGALDDLMDPTGAEEEPVDPFASPNPLDATDEDLPPIDEVREGQLSPESSTADSPNGDPSAQNQANLEARFINLYENLMEKQISFKEAVEAFKTDNQNAAKG